MEKTKSQLYYEANKNMIKMKQKEYYKTHKDEIAKQQREYTRRESSKERRRLAVGKYREKPLRPEKEKEPKEKKKKMSKRKRLLEQDRKDFIENYSFQMVF